MAKLQKNQGGFSAIERLLILVIVVILGITGWYVWHAKQNTDKSLAGNQSMTTTPPDANYTDVVIPSAWETYTDNTYGISIKYPAGGTAIANRLSGNSGSDKAEYYIGIGDGHTSSDGGGGYEIRVLDTSLNQAIDFYRTTMKQNVNPVVVTKSVSKSGYQGVKVTHEYTQENPHEVLVTAEYFFAVKGKVYQFSTVTEKTLLNPDEISSSKAVFNSLKFN